MSVSAWGRGTEARRWNVVASVTDAATEGRPPRPTRSKPINIARGTPGIRQHRGDLSVHSKNTSCTELRGCLGPGVPRALVIERACPPKPQGEGGSWECDTEYGLPGPVKNMGGGALAS